MVGFFNAEIIALNKITTKDLEQPLISKYLRWLGKFVKVKELQPKINTNEPRLIKEAESEAVVANYDGKRPLILLDELGEQLSSQEFAAKMQNNWANASFVIGGAYGHSPKLLERANYKLALGKMTMPHKLARLLLIEQLYRAHTILNNTPYHK